MFKIRWMSDNVKNVREKERERARANNLDNNILDNFALNSIHLFVAFYVGIKKETNVHVWTIMWGLKVSISGYTSDGSSQQRNLVKHTWR